MKAIGVGAGVVLLWLLTSVPLGMLVGAALRRGEEGPDRPAPHIPRQRGIDSDAEAGGSGPYSSGRLAGSMRASLRGAVATGGILVGALTFTVGTAAAVSSLPGPTPQSVAGVIDAVTPFRSNPQPADQPVTSTKTVAAPKRSSGVAAKKAPAPSASSASTSENDESVPAASASPEPSVSATPSASASPGESPSPDPSATGSPEPSPTGSATATPTGSPTASASESPLASAPPAPSADPTPSAAPSPLTAPAPTR